MTILGFTGTQQGMTHRQRETVRYLFSELKLTKLHHGDCIGADMQAHNVAVQVKAQIVIHPPTADKRRGFISNTLVVRIGGGHTILPAKPYLVRNKDIVKAGVDGLIAAPKEITEQLRSGTWATVRYARKAKRRIWIVYPDGMFKEENAPWYTKDEGEEA